MQNAQAQVRREPLDFLFPVADERGRDNEQDPGRRMLPVHLSQICEYLQGFSKAHVIRQARAEAHGRHFHQPGVSGGLVGSQHRVHIRGQLRLADFRWMPQLVQQPGQVRTAGDFHVLFGLNAFKTALHAERLDHGQVSVVPAHFLQKRPELFMIHFHPFALDKGKPFRLGQKSADILAGKCFAVHRERRGHGQKTVHVQDGFAFFPDGHAQGHGRRLSPPPVRQAA